MTWRDLLRGEFKKPYMIQLLAFLESERKKGKVIYPAQENIFNALKLTPFEDVKAVIIGQDPYHGPRQAHGLCFSVQYPTPPPPSLINIFKEISSDLKIPLPRKGDLTEWARNGIFLLNSVLTVEAGKPGSHQGHGWEIFTDKVIECLNTKRDGLVFLLWGKFAQNKASTIDSNRHLVLKADHPSPLSAYRGFFNQHHFSKAQDYINKVHGKNLDWGLSVD